MLSMQRFEEFYQALYQRKPFPWQKRLALKVAAGEWPVAIALPTAAGKTTCIDIAVFALACQAPNAARRIFFIVDRRIVVDQAYVYAKELSQKLAEAKSGIVEEVAASLKVVANSERPLDVYALRGGMYRETSWVRSPLQPTIIASTVDQVGSRLLFRGYGVSESMMPIHAGLVGNDSLILLDEAHCAKPFDQTVRAIKHYRSWYQNNAPFDCVSITATPLVDGPVERDNEEDRNDPVLGRRILASKPAKLLVAEKAKGKNGQGELVKALKAEAETLAKSHACVGIIVNRVATARKLADALGKGTVLLTGRMRPLDRDKLYQEKLHTLLSNSSETPPQYVVGTQCLECGADFDFHALVTECASLDALRQRFGRLNRIAKRDSAQASIVIRGDEIENTEEDPVYAESLANTWKWLKAKSTNEVVDFGIAAMRQLLDSDNVDEIVKLNAPATDAPVLLPAYLDCWVQTHPIPEPDPNPALFLHGPVKLGQPDVQIVFRGDLGDDTDKWAEIVSLIPPSSSEAVSVPISVFRRWLAGESFQDSTTDVEHGDPLPENIVEHVQSPVKALEWKGLEKSRIIDHQEVRPNHTYVVRTQANNCTLLGDFPDGQVSDQAEEAFLRSRDKLALRFYEFKLNERDEQYEASLMEMIEKEWKKQKPTEPCPAFKQWLIEPHPLNGIVVTSKRRLHLFDPAIAPTILDEPDDSYRSTRAVALEDHCLGVAAYARRYAAGCGLDADLFEQAGLWHDLGKLDPRFQAMLKQLSPRTAIGTVLAKSERVPKTLEEREYARELHGYPKGARHELLSVAMLATATDDDLLLHLIGTHHGSARPFANPIQDTSPIQFKKEPILHGIAFKVSDSRQNIAAWNADLPERFWRMVNQYGWWGLAYQEAIFRLADHAQSSSEQKELVASQPVKPQRMTFSKSVETWYPLELSGLDGANPLGFLAGLGTLMVMEQAATPDQPKPWLKVKPKLAWGTPVHPQVPLLYFANVLPSETEFLETLETQLSKTVSTHSMRQVVEILEQMHEKKPDAKTLHQWLHVKCSQPVLQHRRELDWLSAMICETSPEAASQLQTTRRDYVLGNFHSILARTTAEHLNRTLFMTWDYCDGLDNQSLHWEPMEDRRHAYQWHMPSGDPTRKKKGGMLGANRLALEAWPLFLSVAADEKKASTRGFRGLSMFNTFWTWPLWSNPYSSMTIASLLSLESLHDIVADGIPTMAFRSQRILVGKTPNLTVAHRVA
jgi:CRISPR-associated endonuclease/helicase Cas3